MLPSLLVSIHDVSPATLDVSRRLVDSVLAHGVPLRALTVLVIPKHENGKALDDDPRTCSWLRELADAGACLCLHGMSHRMTGRPRNLWQWIWAQGFARGQGELYLSDTDESWARILSARAIIDRSGLGGDVHGFVPPAWLLSAAARKVVEDADFAFHERLAGIRVGELTLARRLIGFGSLNALESSATSLHAWLQTSRRAADTRLALHPADVTRPTSRRAIDRTLSSLLPRMSPMNYMEFLGSHRRRAAAPGPA